MFRPVAFTTEQAPGAILNGTVVQKVKSEAADTHSDGSLAKVVGSIGPFEDQGATYGYFVEWDDMPMVPVFIAGDRVSQVCFL